MPETWVHTHLPKLLAGERDCLSVKVPGQRIAYASDIVLESVVFRVSAAGRRRCLESGQRNVHAWVVGTEKVRWFGGRTDRPWSAVPGWRRALYDPFKGGAFVDSETLEPVASASAAIVSGKFVHYLP